MIRLEEPDDFAAEILFFLPQIDDPRLPKLGHVFTLGEVQIRLSPDAPWIDVALARLMERGRGWYAIRLTPPQRAALREIAYRANCAGAQPDRGTEIVGVLSGDLLEHAEGVQPFYLANYDDPVNGPPVEGHVFVPGEVIISLPDAAFANVDPTDIIEFGGGLYGVLHDETTTAKRGKSIVVAVSPTDEWSPFGGYRTILGVLGDNVLPPILPPAEPPQTSLLVPQTIEPIDHEEAAINRLPQQFRKPKIEAILRTLCRPMAALEQAFVDLLKLRTVETAVGAQLRVLGRLVGQPEVDVTATTYRGLIRARIKANKSSGLGNQVLIVIRAVITDYASQADVVAAGEMKLWLRNCGHASYVLSIEGIDLPWDLAALVAEFLAKSSASAVSSRVVFVVQQGGVLDQHTRARRWADAVSGDTFAGGWGDSVAGNVGGHMSAAI